MRILICHGYLLRGTGSNQYVQSLARALCGKGHHVVVMCQDDEPELDFVTAFLEEKNENGTPQIIWEKETEYPGNCMAFKPDIGGLLPVYVMDAYPGFTVKEFTQLDELELETYVDKNRRALRRLVEQFVPEVIHTNHAVMLPYIARPIAEEHDLPYFVSIHGSAIEFTVKKDSRYLSYGVRGLEGAHGILVPSEHTAAQVTEVFGSQVEDLREKMTVIPPGVDTNLFHPSDLGMLESLELMLRAVKERTSGVTVGDFIGRSEKDSSPTGAKPPVLDHDIDRINALHPEWIPDPGTGAGMESLARGENPFVMFLGKLLETKGIQCVVPAFPLVLREYPEARLVVVGFGELRGILELMIDALDDGELRTFKQLCDYGNEVYAERTDEPFTPVLTFLDELAGEGGLDDYLRLCVDLDLRGSIIFTGYLTPEEHCFILPFARALLIPSLAQEAFGMVATEAMASGVVPVATYHSGLQTALEPMKAVWGSDSDSLLLGTREKMVFRIASACRTVLEMPDETLAVRGREMRAIVKQRFSWGAIAGRFTSIFEDASRG